MKDGERCSAVHNFEPCCRAQLQTALLLFWSRMVERRKRMMFCSAQLRTVLLLSRFASTTSRQRRKRMMFCSAQLRTVLLLSRFASTTSRPPSSAPNGASLFVFDLFGRGCTNFDVAFPPFLDHNVLHRVEDCSVCLGIDWWLLV